LVVTSFDGKLMGSMYRFLGLGGEVVEWSHIVFASY
jgi:hypothetical protein